MYGNITIEDLQRDDYQSSARNKQVVEAFYLTGDIEKYGTGYRRIRKAIKDYPTMQFTYRETQGGYFTELSYEKQKNSTEVSNRENGELNGELNGKLNGELNRGQSLNTYRYLLIQ